MGLFQAGATEGATTGNCWFIAWFFCPGKAGNSSCVVGRRVEVLVVKTGCCAGRGVTGRAVVGGLIVVVSDFPPKKFRTPLKKPLFVVVCSGVAVVVEVVGGAR